MSAAQNALPALDMAIDSTFHYRPFFFRPEKCFVFMGIYIKYRDADTRTVTAISVISMDKQSHSLLKADHSC